MTFKEYQEEASRTRPDLGSLEKDCLHMQLGIITEIGESLDIFKKEIAYGKEKDLVNLGEELADISWYIANLCTLKEIVPSEEKIASYIKQINSREITETLIIDSYKDILISCTNIDFFCKDVDVFIATLRGIAEFYNLEYSQLLQNNINKLKVRYPEKFTQEAALNRNLEAERKELEK